MSVKEGIQAAIVRGWKVIPVSSPEMNWGKPGKTPLIQNWPNSCTDDLSKVQGWFKKWPGMNYGVVTGRVSGIVIVDIDGEAGRQTLKDLESKYEPLPETATVITGSGGIHKVFNYPKDVDIDNKVNLMPGFDIRGSGGMVVGVGSRHVSGKVYEWDFITGPPEDTPIADLPDWVIKLIKGEMEPVKSNLDVYGDSPIEEGERDATLYKMACFLRGVEGLEHDEILTRLFEINNTRCNPPMDDATIEQKVKMACKHPRGISAQDAFEDGVKLDNGKFPLTELGNAERTLYQCKGDIRYCPELKSFLIWSGKRWRVDTDGGVMRRVVRMIRGLRNTTGAFDPEKQLKWAYQCEAKAKLEASAMLIKTLSGVPVHMTELNAQKYLFNCNNGTLDLKAGILLDHDKSHMLTHLTPINYDPTAKAPTWIKFIGEITGGDLDVMRYLQKLAGLCLSGDTSEHLLNILYGGGRNGKGVYLDIITDILGDLALTMPFSTFESTSKDAIPNDIAAMQGKRLIVAQESNEGKALNEAKVKALTGGDKLTGRFLHAEFFQFVPTHKIIMATNNRPAIKETTDAIWSRIRMIPFDVSFAGKEDHKLPDKLKEEYAGILVWMVEGFKMWQAEGLPAPASIKQASDEYRQDEDVFSVFLSECTEDKDDTKIKVKDLHREYIFWADQEGIKPFGVRELTNKLRKCGYIVERYTSGNFVKDLAIRNNDLTIEPK